MKQQAAFLKQANIITLCIFRSTPASIEMGLSGVVATDSLTLSDRKGIVYDSFHVRRTAMAAVKGTIEVTKNINKYKQYLNNANISVDTKGRDGMKAAIQLPADFCIDEDGIVVDVFRAKKSQDHMSLERIEAFVPPEKRCKCSKKDCLFPSCRQRYEEIMEDAAAMLYFGGD
mmetsp:Transcript_15324/g.32235  ORF Transcript_15324/g.32235 Transcript_15324/m.32235 type:complete len:173 (+) Transcript_15324:372-890(+)|eukprot:CAMPEP_0171344744 /NCGR_PEP_ID=MMETSP0878-20121228/20052_1 /TAXON_ID=67004 /ORGANISM="Thalassiosira weissflogii, Strain CCMP1336" /LENGTH=172 /DNA_ID=CAMNT_0011848001 /DNA_START=278 /DNA_END=796 /DNA_ORIENTATION=+